MRNLFVSREEVFKSITSIANRLIEMNCYFLIPAL